MKWLNPRRPILWFSGRLSSLAKSALSLSLDLFWWGRFLAFLVSETPLQTWIWFKSSCTRQSISQGLDLQP